MKKPKLKVIEFFDLTEAVEYIASIKNLDDSELFWRLEADIILEEGGFISLRFFDTPTTKLFKEEFGEDAVYKWQ